MQRRSRRRWRSRNSSRGRGIGIRRLIRIWGGWVRRWWLSGFARRRASRITMGRKIMLGTGPQGGTIFPKGRFGEPALSASGNEMKKLPLLIMVLSIASWCLAADVPKLHVPDEPTQAKAEALIRQI